MKNTKGFTLMEILAVLLVIAVVASFAVPLIKSVRREMRYQKAKAAGVQLAEAVKSFYTNTKGCLATGEFSGADTAGVTCPADHSASTGIPGGCSGGATVVFGCGYISPKMFVDLPYTFTVSDPRSEDSEGVLVTGTENMEGGRSFTINRDMTITEDDDD